MKNLPCSHIAPIMCTIPPHVRSVDMVVSWAGVPTLEREQARVRYLSYQANGGSRVPPPIDVQQHRFTYNGELPILIRRAFAYGSHWMRNLHIIMPDECVFPNEIIRDALGDMYETLRVRIHIHRDSSILPRDALPVFNSHPKEANLDRIPGLSEQFVYANDDMFLNQTTPAEFFFSSTDGRPRYRGNTREPGCMDRDRNHACIGQHGNHVYQNIQHNTASLFWTASSKCRSRTQKHTYVNVDHQMKALTRSGYRRARALFPDAFAKLTHTRFRSIDDFSPTVLIPNLELASGLATLDTDPPRSHEVYLELTILPTVQRNLMIIRGCLQRCYLLCVNNGCEDWHGPWLTKHFDIPSSYLHHAVMHPSGSDACM